MQTNTEQIEAPATPQRSTKEALARWGLWLLVVAPLLISAVTDATVCPSARFIQQPCPGCGLTRATYAALSGDFALAFKFHPMFPLLAPFYFGSLAYGSWVLLGPASARRSSPGSQRWFKRFGAAYIVMIVLMIAVWAARFFGAFGGPVAVGQEATGHPHPFVDTSR